MVHLKLNGRPDGKFHCDDLLAVAMLIILPEYADAKVFSYGRKCKDSKWIDQANLVRVVEVYYHPRLRYGHRKELLTICSSDPDIKPTRRLSSA